MQKIPMSLTLLSSFLAEHFVMTAARSFVQEKPGDPSLVGGEGMRNYVHTSPFWDDVFFPKRPRIFVATSVSYYLLSTPKLQ